MGDIPKYLDEYQKLCMQQLSYLSQRMTQREMLDKEIADLYEKAKSDYQYVHAILEKSRAETEDNAKSRKNRRTTKNKRTYTTRPVLQMAPDRKILHQFDTLAQASQATGILSNYISIAARTKSYTRDGSYWQFLEDYQPPGLNDGLMSGIDVTRPVLPESAVDADAAGGKPDDTI